MDTTESEKREKVLDLIDSLSTAMLVTIDESGEVHARPMAVPTGAEYWDYSGVGGLKLVLAWTEALLSESGIDYQETDAAHARVELG